MNPVIKKWVLRALIALLVVIVLWAIFPETTVAVFGFIRNIGQRTTNGVTLVTEWSATTDARVYTVKFETKSFFVHKGDIATTGQLKPGVVPTESREPIHMGTKVITAFPLSERSAKEWDNTKYRGAMFIPVQLPDNAELHTFKNTASDPVYLVPPSALAVIEPDQHSDQAQAKQAPAKEAAATAATPQATREQPAPDPAEDFRFYSWDKYHKLYDADTWTKIPRSINRIVTQNPPTTGTATQIHKVIGVSAAYYRGDDKGDLLVNNVISARYRLWMPESERGKISSSNELVVKVGDDNPAMTSFRPCKTGRSCSYEAFVEGDGNNGSQPIYLHHNGTMQNIFVIVVREDTVTRFQEERQMSPGLYDAVTGKSQ